MGYSTDFDGSVTISPPLTEEQANQIQNFSQQRQGGAMNPYPGMPGIWCDWTVNDEGSSLFWNGSEKFYNYIEWLNYLIDNFFRPWGCSLNGNIYWQGEEVGDVGKIKVINSFVFVERFKIDDEDEG